MRPHGKPSELEKRRLRFVELHQLGWSQTDIADEIGATQSTVSKWVAIYKKHGVAGLKAKPSSGRPPKLSLQQKQMLVDLLIKGARASGFPTDLWTCPRIAKLIRQKTDVKYHVDYIPRLMRSLGFSPSEASQKSGRTRREKDWRLD
jgi:transposase